MPGRVGLADRVRVGLLGATARWTVRYGEALRFAGTDLPDPEVVRVPTRHGRVPVHLYRPDPSVAAGGEPRAAHVHLHGGAWLMRHPRMDDWWCRYLAATTGALVANVDFHVAPRVRFPVAQEQSHDVACWVAGRHDRFAVGGFSSGGGMAAAVCLLLRDGGGPAPALQVLGVPALDLASEVPAQAGMISPQLRALVRRAYFPDPATRTLPAASPLLAPDLRGLPPAVVLTAERDTLRADGARYAERLREAGVEVWHHDTPGVDHYLFDEDPEAARTTMAEVARRLRAALGQGAP